MGIAENIAKLRRDHELTQEELGKVAGVTLAAVSEWEHGRSVPKMGRIQKIADHFGIPKSALIEDGGLDRLTRTPFTTATTAPLYGTIAAGTPIESVAVEDALWAPPDVLAAHPRGFYLRVRGESMNRVLPDGCFAFVDPDAEVLNGDMAALNVNGYDATIKRYRRIGRSVTLSPDSTDDSFEVQEFDEANPEEDRVTLIGKVVWWMPPYGGVR